MANIEPITHENITVEGFPFHKILNLKIAHTVNEYASCLVVGEMEADTAAEILKRTDETTRVDVVTSAPGQPQKLFCGVVADVYTEAETQYVILTLKLRDMCSRLDIQKRNRTYQNTAKTYGQIIDDCLAGSGNSSVTATDEPIGELIMQYGETNWEFVKRMASHLSVPIVTDITAAKPNFFVGMPPSEQAKDLSSISYQYGKDADQYSRMGSNGQLPATAIGEDFSSPNVLSYSYSFVGHRVQFNGTAFLIQSIHTELVDGLLTMAYSILRCGGSGGSGSTPAGFTVPKIQNVQIGGKMLTGQVKSVAGDKVKVHLDIDSEYDGGGTWEFPYSTAYSSQDGSGWYCMPEENDIVRVFFPSNNAGEAFAASSVCTTPPKNYKDKCWITPNGKKIVLSPGGILISCNDQDMYIDLTDEKGIVIHSGVDITVTAGKNLNVFAEQGSIVLRAENSISLGTDSAFIDMTDGYITLAGKQVIVD